MINKYNKKLKNFKLSITKTLLSLKKEENSLVILKKSFLSHLYTSHKKWFLFLLIIKKYFYNFKSSNFFFKVFIYNFLYKNNLIVFSNKFNENLSFRKLNLKKFLTQLNIRKKKKKYSKIKILKKFFKRKNKYIKFIFSFKKNYISFRNTKLICSLNFAKFLFINKNLFKKFSKKFSKNKNINMKIKSSIKLNQKFFKNFWLLSFRKFNIKINNKLKVYYYKNKLFNSFIYVNDYDSFSNYTLIYDQVINSNSIFKFCLLDYFNKNYVLYIKIFKINLFFKKSITKLNKKKSLKKKFRFFLKFDFNKKKTFFFKKSLNFFFLFTVFSLFKGPICFKKSINMFNNYFSKYKKANFLITSVTPLKLLPWKVRTLVTRKTRGRVDQLQSVFFRQYVGGYFEDLLQSRFFIRVIPFIDIPVTVGPKIFKVIKKYNYFQKIIGVGFFLGEMILLFWYSLNLKDPKFFLIWFCKSMTKLNITKHKQMVKLLSYLINDELVLFLNSNFIKGVKFDIRGKVGVSGDSKKRHTMITSGYIGYSRKNYKIEYQQGIVYTDTGVLGVTLIYVF